MRSQAMGDLKGNTLKNCCRKPSDGCTLCVARVNLTVGTLGECSQIRRSSGLLIFSHDLILAQLNFFAIKALFVK